MSRRSVALLVAIPPELAERLRQLYPATTLEQLAHTALHLLVEQASTPAPERPSPWQRLAGSRRARGFTNPYRRRRP